ncbi:hypothetical protein BW730_16430 [Tessaracoccus aquimaris]|uniref:RNA polymerase sigma-70 region 4 domain-containing protein n=1 Tax=Tessaracoccus aquimaris TaxID=1332264 RepID=A0A1Q2CRV5_9ACTN|nr:SigE family RNA polymerase sigma factor [Tessaracoccus aquimaris]AQP48844.1 hypothetical protein BW730_16430 [Tessaracoccus aquimaris]
MARTDDEFDAFVRASFGRLTRTGYLICGDWHKAEDAAQAALLRLHPRWNRVAQKEAYARRALVTILIDESRRPWRREAPQDDIRDTTVADEAGTVDERVHLAGALAELTPRRRACVVLRFYLDASVADTAAALGCSEGNVKRMTSEALHALRHILTPTGASHGRP